MDEKVLISLLSHELRSSLWGAEGLIRLMQEDMTAELGDEATDTLLKIRESIGESRSFLNRLIDLYRMGERPINKEPLDLAQMVQDEWDQLLGESGLQEVVFQLEKVPSVMSDPRLVREILRELLSNALKAVRLHSHPEVKVHAVHSEQGLGCEIEDNGIGFRSDLADRLFKPSGRLHPRERFPGTGLGLVLVKEMIERLGGQVWGEGELNRGAKFGFLLDK